MLVVASAVVVVAVVSAGSGASLHAVKSNATTANRMNRRELGGNAMMPPFRLKWFLENAGPAQQLSACRAGLSTCPYRHFWAFEVQRIESATPDMSGLADSSRRGALVPDVYWPVWILVTLLASEPGRKMVVGAVIGANSERVRD